MKLTQKETEVIRLRAAGKAIKQVADELVLNSKTVSARITAVYRKLGIQSVAELTLYAVREGIINL